MIRRAVRLRVRRVTMGIAKAAAAICGLEPDDGLTAVAEAAGVLRDTELGVEPDFCPR